MQRYKCNTKEKKNIFVRRTCGRKMVDSVYKLPKRFVDLIYLYTCLKLRYWFQVKDLYDHIAIHWLNIGYLQVVTGPLKLIELLFGR